MLVTRLMVMITPHLDNLRIFILCSFISKELPILWVEKELFYVKQKKFNLDFSIIGLEKPAEFCALHVPVCKRATCLKSNLGLGVCAD